MNTTPALDFKSLFEKAPGLYLVLLPDFTISAVSDAYLKATMTEREAILGHDLFEIFPDNPDDIAADGVLNLRASLNYVLEHRQPHKMAVQKYDIRRPDGSFEMRYWSPLNTPVINAQNELIYIIHNVEDVTSRTKSEEKFRSLLDAAPDATIIVNEKGEIDMINRKAENLFGYGKEEMTGRPVEMIIPEEFRNKHVQHRGNFMTEDNVRAMSTVTELSAVKKDGTQFPVDISLALIHTEEGVLVSASVRDISHRKAAQEQLESLSRQINQSNDAIYTVDAGYKIRSWNRGAQNLYGFTKEEALGKDSNELLRTAITYEEIDILLKKIAVKDYWTGELQRKAKDGKDIYVHSSTTSIRDSTGVITGYIAVSFDITEQKKLREQVNHLANIVEQSSEAIISRGIDQRFISWNSGAERLFGYSKEEAIRKTPNDLRFTGLTETEIADIGQQIIEKGSWNSEREFFHKNGSSFFGTVNANAVKNEQGEITSLVFIIKDISLQKQLEEHLKRSNQELEQRVNERTAEIEKNEKRFRALIENNYDIISLMDEQFKIIYRSPSASRITGWTDEDLKGKNGTKNIHPDDVEKAKDIIMELMANPGKAVNALFRNQHKDGHYLWLEGTVINLLHDGYVKAILFNFRDVTARIEAEEKLAASEMHFRSLIEHSAEGIAMTDEKSDNLYRSPAGQKILGDVTKENTTSIAHPEYLATIINKRDEALRNPGIPVAFLGRFLHGSGHYIWLEGTLTNLLHVKEVNAVVTNFRDVTKRIEAEEKLITSENRFRALVENNFDIISLIDESFNVIYRSPSVTRVMGFETGEMKKLEGIENVHPDDRAIVAGIIREAMANPGKPLSAMFRRQHKNGHYVWLEGRVTNLLHDKYVKAIVTNVRDITERIEAEEKLTASEQFFRALIENSNDIITLMDGSFKLLYRSPAATRLTGWTNEDMLGMDATKNIHPEDQQYAAAIVTEVMTNPAKKINSKFRMRHKIGHYLWVEGTLTNLLHDKDVKAIVFNFRDVTERISAEKKLTASERRFRKLIENNHDIIVLTDAEFKIIYRSPSATRITGWANEEMEKVDFIKKIHPDDRKKMAGIFEECVANPGKHVNAFYRTYNKKGDCLHMEGIMINLLHEEDVHAILLNLRDVTERIEAEAKLADSEMRFRLLIENSADGIDLSDEFSNNIYRSPGAIKITGNLPKENQRGFTHPDDVETIKNLQEEFIKKPGVPVAFQARFRHELGHYIWVEGTVTNLLHVAGVHAFVTNFRDITQRKELEVLLHKANVLARIGGWEVDLVKGTAYWSDITREIHETENSYVPDLATGINFYKEGKERDLITQKVKEAIELGKSWDVELQIITAKNNERWIRSIGETEFINEKCVRIYGSFQDIDQRKKAEEKIKSSEEHYRMLVEQSVDGIFLSDANGRYVDANSSGCKMLGYTRKEIVTMSLPDVLTEAEVKRLPEAIASLEGGTITNSEWVFKRKDGSTFIGEVIGRALPDGRLQGILRDITDRKNAEEKIKNMNIQLEERVIRRTEQLRKTNEELEAFSYSVSHDLRAPLRAIIGYTAILEEDYSSKLDDEAKRLTTVIKSNTVRMGNLIDDLLAFSRMGRHDLVKTSIDSTRLVHGIIKGMDKNGSDTIKWTIPSLPSVKADMNMMRQVWINLLSNAIKYSGKSAKPTVEIGSLKENGQIIFYVKDNGVGFSEKYKNKLFRVFQRLHSAEEFEGTGIGLAIVEKIISKHGGKVWAEAEVNKGAAFYFSLPEK